MLVCFWYETDHRQANYHRDSVDVDYSDYDADYDRFRRVAKQLAKLEKSFQPTAEANLAVGFLFSPRVAPAVTRLAKELA